MMMKNALLIFLTAGLCFGWINQAVSDSGAEDKSSGGAKIKSLIRHYVSDRLSVPESEIEVRLATSINEPSSPGLSEKEYSIHEGNPGLLLGHTVFLINSLKTPEGSRPQWVVADVERIYSAIVPVHPLKKFQIVQPEDVEIKQVHSSSREEPVRYLAKTVGKRVTQQVMPGIPLTEALLETAPLFHTGDRVTLLVETGSVVITAPGRAMEEGFKGKIISAVNLESRRVVYGEALDGKTIKIGHVAP
ncbi:MAG: flagellar basal body P-ring formation protein FlgA [Nitrospirae bacterium]|nr:flagellar basal body P-ring formation protein FlgA [Nitrospirota bacterium]MBI3351488.1 flagellar basal body P-ring formation protein FlgA [Nitrospirota bacterium]